MMRLVRCITIFAIGITSLTSCDFQKEFGTVVFYTNIQAILNCGAFDVDIYIDGVYEGKLEFPLLPLDSIPDCNADDNLTSFKIELPVGEHEYEAKASCLEYIDTSGIFTVNQGGCTIIHAESGEIEKK